MKLYYLLLSGILIVFCSACTLSKPATETKRTFTFDYTPKENAAPGSAGMLLALVKPYYANNFLIGSNELFSSFRSGIASDVEELLIAKGFTLKGPYDAIDEMIFEDKTRTQILVQLEIGPRFTAVEGKWKRVVPLVGHNYYSYEGKASLAGKINLSGVEPLANEKIWAKSVLIPNIENVLIKTTKAYPGPISDNELLQDPGVYNAIGTALQAQYQGIMDKIAAHFSPEEFATLKSQIKELKSKKGY